MCATIVEQSGEENELWLFVTCIECLIFDSSFSAVDA